MSGAGADRPELMALLGYARAGLRAAKKAARTGGRPPKLTTEIADTSDNLCGG